MKFGRKSKSWAAAGRRLFGESNGSSHGTSSAAVALEERDALLRNEIEEPPMNAVQEPETSLSGDPTQRLLTALGKFQRQVAKATSGAPQHTWTDACMTQIITGIEISASQGWKDVQRALTDTARVLQTYEDAGRAADCIKFLQNSYEILCLMVGDLIVDKINSSTLKKWDARFEKAVADLGKEGLTLIEDETAPDNAEPVSNDSVEETTETSSPFEDTASEEQQDTLDESSPFDEPIEVEATTPSLDTPSLDLAAEAEAESSAGEEFDQVLEADPGFGEATEPELEPIQESVTQEKNEHTQEDEWPQNVFFAEGEHVLTEESPAEEPYAEEITYDPAEDSEAFDEAVEEQPVEDTEKDSTQNLIRFPGEHLQNEVETEEEETALLEEVASESAFEEESFTEESQVDEEESPVEEVVQENEFETEPELVFEEEQTEKTALETEEVDSAASFEAEFANEESQAIEEALPEESEPAPQHIPAEKPAEAPALGGDAMQEAQAAMARGDVKSAKQMALKLAVDMARLEVNAAENALEAAEAQVRARRTSIEGAESDVLEVEIALEDLHRAQEEQNAEQARQHEEVEELRGTMATIEGTIADIEAQIRALEEQRDAERKRLEEIHDALEQGLAGERAIQESLDKFTSSENFAQTRLEEARAEVASLQEKCKEDEAALAARQAELEERRAAASEIESLLAPTSKPSNPDEMLF